MNETIGKVFGEAIKLPIKNRNIKMENYFIDGTKIEANANQFTFKWNKSVRYNERRLNEKSEASWKKSKYWSGRKRKSTWRRI